METNGLQSVSNWEVCLASHEPLILWMCSLAGHLVECGAQATGGIFTDWEQVNGWYIVCVILWEPIIYTPDSSIILSDELLI